MLKKKKIFITLSSGILLSLVSTEDIIYAANIKNEEYNHSIEITDNGDTINDLTSDDNIVENIVENQVEVQDLVSQIKISRFSEDTYRLSGNTLKSSQVILIVNDKKYIGRSDEEGTFEIVIKDLTIDSTLEVYITDTMGNIYVAMLPFMDYKREFWLINDETQEYILDEVLTFAPTSEEEVSERVDSIEVSDNETLTETETSVEETDKEVTLESEKPVEETNKVMTPESEASVEETNEKIAPETEVQAEPTKKEEIAETKLPSKKEESRTQASKATMSTFSLAATSSTRTAINGVYTVKAGDSLGAIASSFNLSLSQVLQWNPQIKNVDLITSGQKINVTREAYNKYLEDSKGNNQVQPRPFKTNQEFIDFIAPFAVEIANAPGEEQLYASVMIAQAVHESAFGESILSSPPYYNLFGIKGSYNGSSIPMGTWEETDGGIINITARFRDYPSYYESMLDYANLLRNGLIGDSDFYSPTWVKNTKSYRDATEYLTGTYATDKAYNIKVNNYIEQYNLTQYDTYIVDTNVANTINVNYSALISQGGYSIDTKPWGTSGFKMIDTTNNYLGYNVRIIKETANGNYALVSYNGTILGWIDKKALEMSTEIGDVSSSITVDYKAEISKPGYTIDTLPRGTSGYKVLDKTSNFIGQEVTVVKEAKDGLYSLVAVNDKLIGWIDSKAITSYSIDTNIDASYDTSYQAIIDGMNYSIDTKPWGRRGYHTLGYTSNYLGRKVEIVKETSNHKYVLISYDGKLLGWVDKKSLQTFEVVENIPYAKKVSYNAILKTGYSIDIKPWGTIGYKTISNTMDYNGLLVKVTKEKGAYALIKVGDKTLGWVDRKALQTYTVSTDIPLARPISNTAIISNVGYSIDTKPWDIIGHETISSSADYVGTPVKVSKQKGAYALIEIDGEPLGWIDKKALQMYTVITDISSARSISYSATIEKSGFSIDTKPWGTKGYKTIAKTTDYIGKRVQVTKEKGAYALVSLNDITFGWIDKKALVK